MPQHCGYTIVCTCNQEVYITRLSPSVVIGLDTPWSTCIGWGNVSECKLLMHKLYCCTVLHVHARALQPQHNVVITCLCYFSPPTHHKNESKVKYWPYRPDYCRLFTQLKGVYIYYSTFTAFIFAWCSRSTICFRQFWAYNMQQHAWIVNTGPQLPIHTSFSLYHFATVN